MFPVTKSGAMESLGQKVTPKFHTKTLTLQSVWTFSASFSLAGMVYGMGREPPPQGWVRGSAVPLLAQHSLWRSSASTKWAAEGAGMWWRALQKKVVEG